MRRFMWIVMGLLGLLLAYLTLFDSPNWATISLAYVFLGG